MPVLRIRIYGDPVLHQPAEPILNIDDTVRTLADDMFETMAAAPGVGLAAPQVGVAKRMFVYRWEDETGTVHSGVAVNPELWLAPSAPESLHELAEDEEEGCLSIPGERFMLRRSPRVLLRATNLDGERYEVAAEGWLARIFQHEFDHLNGVIYADRLDDNQHRQAFRVLRRRGWNAPGQSWLPGEHQREGDV